MEDEQTNVIEAIQRLAVRVVATHAAGQGLCLIGGFRYRLLDGGARRSMDVDYHWDGDLAEKQSQLAELFKRRLLPEVKRRWGYEGSAAPATGPAADSPSVRVVDLAFWQEDTAESRIEIPVGITRLICLDKPTIRTADGVVYRTPSDQDMVEGKVVAVFSRTTLQHRDLVDLFLFSNHLGADSGARVRQKLSMAEVVEKDVRKQIEDFVKHRAYHIRAIEEVVTTQLDPPAARSIEGSGGGATVLDALLAVLCDRLKLDSEPIP